MDIKLQKGTRLFLDQKSCASIPKIENMLRKIGVVVDEFLSKDVDFIVTDNKVSYQNLEKNIFQEGFQKLLFSRGQTLLMKSTSVNSASQFKNDPVQFAQKFSVPLITGDELKKILQTTIKDYKFIKKKYTQESNLLTLKYNFIKIEDCSQQFLPSFKKFLELSQKESMENNVTTIKSLKKIVTKENRGYCECCDEFYDTLSFHRRGRVHLSFISNDKNFICIDMLINQLPSLDNLKASGKKICYSTSDETKAGHFKTIMCSSSTTCLQDYSMQFTSKIMCNNFTKYKDDLICSICLNSGKQSPCISYSCLGWKQCPQNCKIKSSPLNQDSLFQNCNTIYNQQTSSDIYTCVPTTECGQALKLVLKRITHDSNAEIRDTKPIKNIIWQSHQQNFLTTALGHEVKSQNYGSSGLCNESIIPLSYKDYESGAKQNSRKQIKARRRCKLNRKIPEQKRLTFHNADVNCQPLYSIGNLSTVCDFIMDYDMVQPVVGAINFNCWSLRYLTELKVVLTKLRSC